MDQLELTLLGKPEVRYEGQTLSLQSRHIALISYLALQNKPCSRDELTEILWGAGRSANLRVALSKLRKHPGAEGWLGDGERLNVQVHSDVGVLEKALASDTLSADVLGHLERAADPEVSRLLLDLSVPTPAYETWLGEQRRRVDTLVERLLLRAAEDLWEGGQTTRASTFTENLLQRDPLNETAYRLLMQLEVARGQPEVAQEVFERLRRTLREQLGEEPSEETHALHRQLLGTGTGARGRYLRRSDPIPGKAEYLFGRTELLEQVRAALASDPVLLYGLGGVGKTALAAEVASGYLNKGDVLWLQAGLSSADELLEAAGQLLQVQGVASKPERLGVTLSEGTVELLVIDDAWNEAALQALRDYVPHDLPLLVTARQRFKKLNRFDVAVLSRGDAHALLVHEADQPLTPEQTDTLCTVLGDHPFALRLAGAKLKQDQLTPTQLLAQLAGAPHHLVSPRGWRESGRESFSALLQTSLETLSDNAYYAFLAIGALASGGASAPLLARVLQRDPDLIEAALIELHTRALAERVATPGSDLVRYALHDLSHSFARENNIVRDRTVIRAAHTFVADNARNFEALDVEVGNLTGALEAMRETGDKETLVDTMSNLVIGDAYFSARGHTPRSLALLEVAIGWAKEQGRLEKAHDLSARLGDAYRVQYHEYAKALDAYTEGARLARLLDNMAREAILTSLCGVSQHHLKQSSDKTFEQAYQLARQTNNGVIVGQILQHRGYVAAFYNNWVLVERLNTEAVEIAHVLIRKSDIERSRADDLLFFSLLNLGEAKRKLGNFEEAVALRNKALEIATAQNNQMWQAYALHELGEMYSDNRQRDIAKKYLEEALNLYKANNAQARVKQIQQLLAQSEFTPS